MQFGNKWMNPESWDTRDSNEGEIKKIKESKIVQEKWEMGQRYPRVKISLGKVSGT